MVGQDEGWNVIWRIISPPAFPVGVRPISTNGSEHVSPKNPGPDILKATGGEIIVNPGRTVVLAEQGPLKCARWDQPLVQLRPADTERIVDALLRACSVSVERDGEALNANPCHRLPPSGRLAGNQRTPVKAVNPH
ncbi:hypothetical protein [Pseudomonas sp. JM0905a]|uniref:hypothetical protein n=1 Tax=Pseudomonas sp. JM0905a TaxID=2772484 RepID=UPI001CC228DC